MTRAQKAIANLSDEAKTALINVGSNTQGRIVPPTTLAPVLHELKAEGVVKGYGLTRFGTIVRQTLMTQLEADAFA